MKGVSQLTFAVALFLCSPLALFGQGGQVTIINSPPTRITDAETGQLVGEGYLAALYWAPSGTARDQFVQLGAPEPVVNGLLPQGGDIYTLIPGATVQLIGAAWQSAFGSSYEAARQVIGAKVGESTIVTTTTSDGGGPTLPRPVRIPDFSVAAVPEPATIGLIAVGGLMFLLRRSR